MSRIYSAQKLQLKQNDKNNRKKVYTHTHIDREMRNKEKKVYAEEKGRKRETGGDARNQKHANCVQARLQMEKCCVVLISIHLICTENYTTVLSIAVAKLAHSNNYQVYQTPASSANYQNIRNLRNSNFDLIYSIFYSRKKN